MRKTYGCKSIQKDYVMQKESNTRGLRNAERARN